jgi:hypothetical protein
MRYLGTTVLSRFSVLIRLSSSFVAVGKMSDEDIKYDISAS